MRSSTARTRHPALFRQMDQLRSPEEVASRIDSALDELGKWMAPDAREDNPMIVSCPLCDLTHFHFHSKKDTA